MSELLEIRKAFLESSNRGILDELARYPEMYANKPEVIADALRRVSDNNKQLKKVCVLLSKHYAARAKSYN